MNRTLAPRAVGRLHVITDESLQDRWTHLQLALLAADGGADTVQYREKRPRSTAEHEHAVREIRRALPLGVHLIVDDHVAAAHIAGADGVHLGRTDMAPDAARRLLGARCLIGGTANSLVEARRGFAEPLDYLGVGPVFGTRSKTDPAPALGVEGFAAIAREAPIPVIAIGGITPDAIEVLIEAGAWGVAVLSGIVCAADPAGATALYRAALDRALQRGHVRT